MRGLLVAVGIVELHKLVIEFFAFRIRQPIAFGAHLCGDNRAEGRFFSLRLLAFHVFTLQSQKKVSKPEIHRGSRR